MVPSRPSGRLGTVPVASARLSLATGLASGAAAHERSAGGYHSHWVRALEGVIFRFFCYVFYHTYAMPNMQRNYGEGRRAEERRPLPREDATRQVSPEERLSNLQSSGERLLTRLPVFRKIKMKPLQIRRALCLLRRSSGPMLQRWFIGDRGGGAKHSKHSKTATGGSQKNTRSTNVSTKSRLQRGIQMCGEPRCWLLLLTPG